MYSFSWIVPILLLCYMHGVLGGRYGILAAESSSDKENFCIIYFPQFSSLPREKSEADFHMLEDLHDIDFCLYKPSRNYYKKIILLTLNNCSIASQALVFQEKDAAGVMFIKAGIRGDYVDTINSTEGVNITVGLITENSAVRLTSMTDSPTVRLYATEIGFDLSLFVIWIVAMLTVGIGGYWSGMVRFFLFTQENCKPQAPRGDLTDQQEGGESCDVPNMKNQFVEESSLNISPYAVGVFVLCMGSTLLMLYFFFDYLVYFLIGLFVLVSINSIYVCFYPLVMKVLPKCLNLFQFRYKGEVKSIDYRHLLLLIVAVSVAITWVATRNEKYSWILQDALGMLFCINMLRTIRLPNLKICALLLILLFFYDIFFVFVTPFLTAKGESVMEEVATSKQSEEKLPMVLRVPHFSFDGLSICYQQSTMLGFGDILVPGLLISYCHGFDLITGSGKIYFWLVVASYGIGLLVTFMALLLMETAQPALLYLVPATLIPPVILSWYRREFSSIWNGFKKGRAVDEISVAQNNGSNNPGDVVLPAGTGENQAAALNSVGGVIATAGNVNDTNERKQLLQQ